MADGAQIADDFKLSFENTLSIFNVPNCNLGVKNIRYLTYKPVTQFQPDSTDVRFKIPGVTANYIDLRGIYLKTKVRIVRGDGTKLPAFSRQINSRVKSVKSVSTPGDQNDQESEVGETDGSNQKNTQPSSDSNNQSEGGGDEHVASCGPVNFLSQALWDSIEVVLNNRVAHCGETNYSLKCMLNCLLSETPMTYSDMECSLFIKDNAARMNDFSLLTSSNKGFMQRAKLMEGSREIELQSIIDIDIFKSTTYLVNGISMDINLTATSDKFRLLTANTETTDYKLQVTDVSLVVPTVTLSNAVLISHQEVIKDEISQANYYYEKVQLRKFHIAGGLNSFFVEDAFQGLLPSKITLAFVSSQALNGSISHNPFCFDHYNVSLISITTDGIPSPEGPLVLNFDSDIYMDAFSQLYKGKQQGDINQKSRITRQEYKGGYSLFNFDLEPQKGDSFYPLRRQGNVRIEVRFRKELKESVVMLARITSPGHFGVDYARNINVTV